MQAKMFGQAFGLYRLLEAVKSVNPQVLKTLEVDVPPIFSRQATGRNRFVEKLHAFEWECLKALRDQVIRPYLAGETDGSSPCVITLNRDHPILELYAPEQTGTAPTPSPN